VASKVLTQSGRAMIEALIAGERDPRVLANLARARMRAKHDALVEALDGRFDDHHAELARMLLDQIDHLDAQVGRLTTRIGELIAAIPTAGHLVSWAKLTPRTIQSGARHRSGPTGKGNPYLKGVLGEAAAAAARTDTFLGERYRRIVKRRGKLKALVAVARSILVIVWHLLADPTARYQDLGSGYYASRIDKDRKTRSHIRQLEALGYTVTLAPAA
jgi:transposase